MDDVGKVIFNLHALANQLATAAIMPEKKDLLETANKLAGKLCSISATDRPLAQSQLSVFNNKHSAASQWILKSGVMAALLTIDLGYREEVGKAIVKAAITMDLSVLDVINARVTGSPFTNEMKQRWRKHPILSFSLLREQGLNNAMWLTHVLQHQERINGRGYPSGLNSQNLISTAPLLSLVSDAIELLMPTAKRQGILPETVCSRLYWRRTYYHQKHLRALIDLFQPLPVAAQLGLKRGGIAMVVRKPIKDYVWAVKHFARKGQKGIEVVKLIEQDIARVYPMLKVDKLDLMELWLEGHRQMSNSLSKPWPEPTPSPSKLKVKLGQLLNQEQPSITKVSEYIASEPTLIQVLVTMANREINTKAKPTKAIKHAVMMIGLQRLGPMLLRSDLLAQCRVRRFPLDHWAETYTNLYAECAAQLATHSYVMMPEMARTLAYFAASGWYTDADLTTRIQLKDRLQNPVDLFIFFELLSKTNPEELASTSLDLAKEWKLPLAQEQALEILAGNYQPEEMPMKARHPYYLLMLASHMMIELVGKSSSWHERTALQTRLDISSDAYVEAKEAVMKTGTVFSPLSTG